MNYKKAKGISDALALAAGIAVLFLIDMEDRNALFYFCAAAALLLIAASHALMHLCFQCPHCRAQLPIRHLGRQTDCKHCGKALEAEGEGQTKENGDE